VTAKQGSLTTENTVKKTNGVPTPPRKTTKQQPNRIYKSIAIQAPSHEAIATKETLVQAI